MRKAKLLRNVALGAMLALSAVVPANAAQVLQSAKLTLQGQGVLSTATFYFGPQNANGTYDIVGVNDWYISDSNVNGGATQIVRGFSQYRKSTNDQQVFVPVGNSSYPDQFDTTDDGFGGSTEYFDSSGYHPGFDFNIRSNGLVQECIGTVPNQICVSRLDNRYTASYMPFNSTGNGINGQFTDLVFAPTGGVPEPANWALMIAGFGMVGFTARRRYIFLATSSQA